MRKTARWRNEETDQGTEAEATRAAWHKKQAVSVAAYYPGAIVAADLVCVFPLPLVLESHVVRSFTLERAAPTAQQSATSLARN